MRPFTSVITIAEARRIVESPVTPVSAVEHVPLADGLHRVLAEPIVSPHDVPPFARAAMDGYAVRAADTAGGGPDQPRRLRVVDALYTGQAAGRRIAPGECIQIATGAPMPPGADAVVMVEDTRGDSDSGSNRTVEIQVEVDVGRHVGGQGTDIGRGQPVLEPGDQLTVGRLGSLAAIGLATVPVYVRPRVAIMSTGDEVVEPGRPLALGQVHDVNRYTLGAIVAEHGGTPVPHATAPDDRATLEAKLDSCLQGANLVILSGGSSVGERDLIAELVSARGRLHFHGIAVKPGKPTLYGVIDGTPVFGMSGYPTSCLINAYVLVVPVLRQLARLPPHVPRRVTAPLAQGITSVAGRHQFLTVRVADGMATPTFKSSGDITSMSRANGYVEIPAETTTLAEESPVEVVLF